MDQFYLDDTRRKLTDIPVGSVRQSIHRENAPRTFILPNRVFGGNEPAGNAEVYLLYPGITLTFFSCVAEETACCHPAEPEILEVHYCRWGPSGWRMADGSTIYLGNGDCSIHTRRLCADSVISFPNGYYQGLSISIALRDFSTHLPDLLQGTGITGEGFRRKFCKDGGFTLIPGNEQTASIFGGFFDVPPELKQAYFKLKFQELLLYLYQVDICGSREPAQYRADQIAMVREIHDLLTEHMDQRITIEALSKKFLVNPSTLKATFKAVYGSSIAKHIKEHRMERASALLRDSDLSVGQISEAVGYESQSKFSAEFRKTFHMLPSEYRRIHR